MRNAIVFLLVVAGLAGCVQEGPADDAAPDEKDDAQFEDSDKNLSVLQPDALPREPPAPGERTLNETPLWRLGEWWEYDITAYLTGESETVKRIVAGTEKDFFLVGFPRDQFSNFALVLHHPAYGDIHRDHISYDTHDADFKPMDFPLVEGKSWQTYWQSESNEWTATVTSVDHAAGEAQIDFTTTSTDPTGQTSTTHHGYAIYDAEMGVARELEFPGYANFQVTRHAFNYTGVVRVPHDHDLVFFHGCLAGAQTVTPDNPITEPDLSGCPEGSIEMPPGYDRVSFGLLMQDVAGAAAAQNGADGTFGYYSMDITAPDGETYSMDVTPADQSYFVGEFFENDDPEGMWDYTAVAGGPGVIFIEGIGYHSIDIDLPSGCVLDSENALHHVHLCKKD